MDAPQGQDMTRDTESHAEKHACVEMFTIATCTCGYQVSAPTQAAAIAAMRAHGAEAEAAP